MPDSPWNVRGTASFVLLVSPVSRDDRQLHKRVMAVFNSRRASSPVAGEDTFPDRVFLSRRKESKQTKNAGFAIEADFPSRDATEHIIGTITHINDDENNDSTAITDTLTPTSQPLESRSSPTPSNTLSHGRLSGTPDGREGIPAGSGAAVLPSGNGHGIHAGDSSKVPSYGRDPAISTGTIIGLSIGLAGFVVLLLGVCIFVIRGRRRTEKSKGSETEGDDDYDNSQKRPWWRRWRGGKENGTQELDAGDGTNVCKEYLGGTWRGEMEGETKGGAEWRAEMEGTHGMSELIGEGGGEVQEKQRTQPPVELMGSAPEEMPQARVRVLGRGEEEGELGMGTSK